MSGVRVAHTLEGNWQREKREGDRVKPQPKRAAAGVVPWAEDMRIISTSAVVFLTLMVLIFCLLPETFVERAKPAIIAFRISQIMIAVFVVIPDKEAHAARNYQRAVTLAVGRAVKAYEKQRR